VERIIAGPKVEGNYPTVPPTTQIISVSSAGGICYVNLTQTFVANALNINEKLPVYSIVNSIIDNCRDVTGVQFAIDGDSNIIFRQETDLTKPLEANMELVKKD
jgi:germination protein M